jgi:hypothetical protein
LWWFSCFKCFHAFHNLRRTGKDAVTAFYNAARGFPTLINNHGKGYIPKQVLTLVYRPVGHWQRAANQPTFLDFVKKEKEVYIPNINTS